MRTTRRLSPADCRRILIIKLSSIGDVVMATPAAEALRLALPDAYIAWAVEEKSKDILIGNPYLDEVIVWRRDSVRGLSELLRRLRSRKFDVSIDLQGLLRSSLIGRLSGARHRLGYSDAREGATVFYSSVLPSAAPRVRGPAKYLAMLWLLGIKPRDARMHLPVSQQDVEFARQFLGQMTESDSRGVVVLCPATTWANKHWTEQGWATLCDRLSSEHDVLPLFLGGPADTELIESIIKKTKLGGRSLAGKTTLGQAAAIIRASRMLIGVDTGLLHMAVALDKPVVGVFGPSGWQDFIKKENFIPVAKPFPCIPCFRHPTCKDYDCMKAITPGDVLQAADRWLRSETRD